MSDKAPGASKAAQTQDNTSQNNIPTSAERDSLAFVMDVPVEVTVEIGRRKIRIAEILKLGAGSILELDKSADEPLDIYVNDKPIARGEAVVVGDHYGVRITEVLNPEEARLRSRGNE